MTNKMDKDPAQAASATGCSVGCVAFVLCASMFGDSIGGLGSLVTLVVSIVAGLIAFFIMNQAKTAESDKEKQRVVRLVNSVTAGSKEGAKTVDQSIELMCRAKYCGGHKKYEENVDVSLVLTKDRILIKELPGYPVTRFNIPYHKISDFGLATKEQLTVTRLLLVGILAFALKKKERYLYIKYSDSLGFELNPVFGEFVGASITSVSSQLYTLIEQAQKA